MRNTETRMKLNKRKILLIFIITIFICTSCNRNYSKTPNEESSVETINENVPNIPNDKNNKDTSYKHRDKVISLIKNEKIFNIKVDSKNTNEDIYINLTLENDKTILEDLDRIRIGLSVQELTEEEFTNNTNLDKSQKYWEIKLNEGELEEVYDLNVSKESDLLTDKDKELLMNKDKSTILRIDVFVDEESPVKIYNHFFNWI